MHFQDFFIKLFSYERNTLLKRNKLFIETKKMNNLKALSSMKDVPLKGYILKDSISKAKQKEIKSRLVISKVLCQEYSSTSKKQHKEF